MMRVSVPDRMKLLGVATIALTGLLHLVEAPEYLGEERYIGVLFILSALGSALSLYGIWRDQLWGWMLGLAVAGGAFAAYILSRTVGLPSFREASWSSFLEPMGLISLVVEAAFVVIALRVLTAMPETRQERRQVWSTTDR